MLNNGKLMDYCVLDTETNAEGWAPHESEIIEIAIAKFVGGKHVGTFHEYIKPTHPVTEKCTSINGITNEMLKDARSNDEVIPDAYAFCGDMICVAHNAQFDFSYLEHYSDGDFENIKRLDTLALSRKIHKRGMNGYAQAGHKQEHLGAHYKVKNIKRHSALGDVTELKLILDGLLVDDKENFHRSMIRKGPAKKRS